MTGHLPMRGKKYSFKEFIIRFTLIIFISTPTWSSTTLFGVVQPGLLVDGRVVGGGILTLKHLKTGSRVRRGEFIGWSHKGGKDTELRAPASGVLRWVISINERFQGLDTVYQILDIKKKELEISHEGVPRGVYTIVGKKKKIQFSQVKLNSVESTRFPLKNTVDLRLGEIVTLKVMKN